MKKYLLLWTIAIAFISPLAAQVGIGTNNPAPSAMLEISSTSKGLLLPRLTAQQIKNIPSPVAGLLVYNADQNKPCFYNGTDWLNYDGTLALPKPGYYYAPAGGIVIYLDATGLHGIVAAMTDAGVMIAWGCSGLNIPGAQFTAIGSGQSNTNAILAACVEPSIAALVCNNFESNGFSDWYMPSYDELVLLYANRAALPGISTGRYWSSSQVNSSMAYIIDFATGQTLNMPLSSQRYVRAVRSF